MAPAGTHSVAARVMDNMGAVATSAAVSISVKGVGLMPLGDSITHGADIPGGYRIGLWSRLINDTRNVDYVGSEINGPSTLIDDKRTAAAEVCSLLHFNRATRN